MRGLREGGLTLFFENLADVRIIERNNADDQVIKGLPQGVEIAGERELFAASLFRTHEMGRTFHQTVGNGIFAGVKDGAEIQQHGHIVLIQNDISGLDIPVAELVFRPDIIQRLGNTLHNLERLGDRKRSGSGDDRIQRLSRNVLHGKEVKTPLLIHAGIECAHDVGVLNNAQRPYFPEELIY